jgi:hypothetical protein
VSGGLEDRYERLLRWYPAGYRRERAGEMLGVLMDGAGDGQRRPSARERRALVVGGLRMRAGVAGSWRVWQSWQSALWTAAVMVLVLNVEDTVQQMLYPGDRFDRTDVVLVGLGLLALVALVRGWFAVAVASAAVMVGANALVAGFPPMMAARGSLLYSPWLVIALLVPLVGRGPVRVPLSLRVTLGSVVVPAGLWLAAWLWPVLGLGSGTHWANMSRASWWWLIALAALWAVVDERPVLTVGLVLLFNVVYEIWVALQSGGLGVWVFQDVGVVAILPVLGMTLGAVVARRRARL